MPVQRVGFVLNEDGYVAQVGVDSVAGREVDDAVFAAEGDRRFGPLVGEGMKPLASPARQNHCEHILHARHCSKNGESIAKI